MTQQPLNPDELPLAYRQGSAIEGFLPIAGFILGEQLGGRAFGEIWGDRIAIIAMTAGAAWSIIQRVRRGQAIGWWIPSVFVYFLIRGIAGLIWGEQVFLAFGIGLKVSLGIAALVSVLIGKAAVGLLIPLVLPFDEDTQAHPVFIKTMRNLTLAYAVYQLVTVGFEIWLLEETDSGTAFFLLRTVAGTATGFVGFFVALLYTDRSLRPIPGFGGVMDMFEQIGLAMEQRNQAGRS